MKELKLSEYAQKKGVSYQTALRWYKSGKLPDKASKTPSGTILVEDDEQETVAQNPNTNWMYMTLFNALPNNMAHIVASDCKVRKATIELAQLMTESPYNVSLNSTLDSQASAISLPTEENDPYQIVKDKLFDEISEVLDSKLSALFINYLGELGSPENVQEVLEQTTTNPLQNPRHVVRNGFIPVGREIEKRPPLDKSVIFDLSDEPDPLAYFDKLKEDKNRKTAQTQFNRDLKTNQEQIGQEDFPKNFIAEYEKATSVANQWKVEINEAVKCITSLMDANHLPIETVNINGVEMPKDPDALRNIPLSTEQRKSLDIAKSVLETHTNLLLKLTRKTTKDRTDTFQAKTCPKTPNEFIRAKVSGDEKIDHLIEALLLLHAKFGSTSPNSFNGLITKEVIRVTGKYVNISEEVNVILKEFINETDKIIKAEKKLKLRELLNEFVGSKQEKEESEK